MSNKPKLSVVEQINHMKSKGIGFNIINEDVAASFLENNNYYFKLKSYAKNYATYQLGESKGRYVNLEYAYLMDLSIIDMHLRHFILTASVDLEHALKVRLLKDFNGSPDDGYQLVGKYLIEHPDVLAAIQKKQRNSYTSDLVNKLFKESFAIWNIIEVLSLKDFLVLYRRFYEEYPESLTGPNYYYPMQAVRKLRNAAAHNTCLINSLRKPYCGLPRYNPHVDKLLTKIDVSKESRRKNKSNQLIYDFITMLSLISEVIPNGKMRQKILDNAQDLFHNRMLQNKEYYSKESSITSAYIFVNKVIDFLCERNYNDATI